MENTPRAAAGIILTPFKIRQLAHRTNGHFGPDIPAFNKGVSVGLSAGGVKTLE
jgi:hypothetical protein